MASEKITIQSILSPELVQVGLSGSSKKKTLQEIAHLVSKRFPHLDEELIFDNLFARERLGSTGIGQGIAIPHSRLENCHQVIGGLFTLKEEIPFDSIDNKDVDLLFLLLVPKDMTSDHLELLSQIAELFNDPKLCEKLRQCKTNEELYKLVVS